MKPNFQFAAFIAAMGCSVLSATATTYQWDVNDATSGLGGAGTWNTTNVFWDLFGSGTDDGMDATSAVTFTSADTAKFGGTAATVTLGTPTTVNGLSFDVDGYTLTGSTLTLAGTSSGVTANGSAIINSAITFGANQSWSVASTKTLTVGGNISGNYTLNKTGSGTLTLGGATYTGGAITVSGGILNYNLTSTTQAAPVFNVSNASVNFGQAANNALQNLTLSNSTFTITATGVHQGGNNGIGTISMTNSTLTSTGAADGYGAITTYGTLAWTLNGTNTISGTQALAPYSSGTFNFNTPLATDATTISAVLGTSQSGSAKIIKSGLGTVTLSGTNTYGGGTTISAGTIIAANNSALSTGGTVTLNDSSTGTNNTTLLIGGNYTIGRNIVVANQGSGTVTIGANNLASGNTPAYTGTLTLNRATTLYNGTAASDFLKFSGVISGSGDITVDGVAGTPNSRVSFQQTSNNTHTGNVNITATGRLQLGAGSGAADMIYDGATVTVASGGLFWLGKGTGGSETIGALSGAGTVAAVWGNNTLTVGGNNQSGSFSGVMKNDGATLSLIKTGSGTQTLTGQNTYNGGTTIQNGSLVIGGTSGTLASQPLTLGNSTNSGILVLGDSSNAKSLTFSSLNTSGTGTANAIVAGGNATASSLTINTTTTDTYAGVFGGAGTNQNLIKLQKLGNGSLALSGGGTVYELYPDAGTLALSGGTLNVSNHFGNSDWGTARTSTVNQTGGSVTLGSGAMYYGSRSSNQAITYNLSGGTFDASAGRFNLSWDGGNPTFTVSGTGVLKVYGLDKANTGSGTLNLTGGQIIIGANGIGNANYFNNLTPNTLNFGGGTIASSAAFSGNAGQAITLTGTNGATTFNTTGGNITLNGALGGAGGLTKSGSGTLSLSAANTYAGTTTINGGTLALTGSGSLASSSIIVGASTTFDVSGVTGGYTSGAGQTISGTGTIVGNITVGGTLAPGNSPGDLGFADNLGLTNTLNLEITGITSGLFDRLVGDGFNTLTLGGILNLNNTGYTATINDTINVFANWQSITGSFTSITGTDLGGGLSWDTSQLSTNGTLTVVPEPRAALLGGIGLFMLLRRRRASC